MAERLRPKEMTEPPSDDTPSKRLSSMANVDFDDILKEIAKALHRDSDIDDLGKALGFGPGEIGRKIAQNERQGGNYMGTLDLLRMWQKGQTPTTEKAALRSALLEARLDNLADQYLSTPVPGDGEAMPSEIMKLREQLKRRYRKKFGQIKTSPVDSQSRTWLQHIYVSLVLMLGLEGEKEEPIDYDGLFKFMKTDTPKGFVTRLAFIGEAGVGKSTLFAKIALDWAEGKILQEINLLFLESFREIKESRFFGDTVMGHFPDDSEIKGEWVDAYVRKNQRKVLILLDGLDEAHIDIKKQNCNDAIVSIVRGDRFIDTPVVITTRPFGADQIKSIMTINDHYTFGKVKGFTKKNMSTYINNYFKDDSQSALTLINFINTNQVVSEYMAPFPIFCCMLCSLWKTPSRRENIQTMETFSQLLKRLVFSLQEQYSSKRNELEEGYESRMNKADESIKELGCIAFQGLLVKQLIFDEKALDSCVGAARTACVVGILSMEKRPAPLQIRESQRKQFIQEFSFPHKLLQEYIASFYLASLFHEDRQEFNTILANTLIKKYKEFRYVLYFTAAHGGAVGNSVLEALCKEVRDMKFIIQVAFECHDSEAIDPVRNLLKTKADLKFYSTDPMAALVFTLESIGKEVVRRSSPIRETLGFSQSFKANVSSSHVAAVGLFTLPNLRSLTFIGMHLDDEFCTGMSAAASQSKIEELVYLFADLGSAASYHYARCLCSMPHLRSLKLNGVKLNDKFYSTMASKASESKIQTLSMEDVSMTTPRRLHSILSLPRLQSLSLTDIRQDDMDDGEPLTLQTSSVVELSVDGKDVISLWNLGLHTLCPRVKKLELNYPQENVSSGIITMACSPFHHLTHLHIMGDIIIKLSFILNDPVSFCDAVKTSCPRLTKLFLSGIALNNEKAAEIIQLMKTHPHLTNIELRWCGTNSDLDPLISEVNSEGKVTVTVKHGLTYREGSSSQSLPFKRQAPHTQSIPQDDPEIPEKQSSQESRRLHLDTTDDGNQVHWVFLTDVPEELPLQDDEAVISCGIRFSPSGAKLSKPIKVTLDHSAHFSNPRCAEIVFYTRNKDSKSFERIPASTSGYPRCDVRAKDLDLYVDHFCVWWIVAVYNWYYDGKRVKCLPFVRPPVRKESYHFVHLCIYDDLSGFFEKIEKEMTGVKMILPSQPMFVEWKHGDIDIKLFEGPKKNEKKIEEQTLGRKDINLVGRKQFSFELKPLESGASPEILKFTLNQRESISDPTVIQCILPYGDTTSTAAAAATCSSMHAGAQTAFVSRLSPTDPESEGSRSRSGPCKRKAPHDSEIQERRSKIDLESDRILDTLSKYVPRKNYITLCRHLDIRYDEAINILGKFKEDCEGATRDCLAQWKTRTGGNMAKLKKILQGAEVGDLAKYINQGSADESLEGRPRKRKRKTNRETPPP